MTDQDKSPTPAKHPQSTAPKSEQDALWDALQAIDPSKVLELVWGLEPQTCSLRVKIGGPYMEWLKVVLEVRGDPHDREDPP
jgi:hypothetical protein